MAKNDRFVTVYKEGSQIGETGRRTILLDRETGVNYLVWHSGYAGGITPLLDKDGKVVVTRMEL